MTQDYEYHRNKKPEKTYISKSISYTPEGERRYRLASKVFDSDESHHFAVEKGELVIRATEGGRQEVVAKFYEDTRGLTTLTFQKFTLPQGTPHKIAFSFGAHEISRLLKFLRNLKLLDLSNQARINLTDDQLERMLLNPEQARQLVIDNQELVMQLAQSEVTKADIVALGYRKKELEYFERLLSDAEYFEQERAALGKTEEGLWQFFFERNRWVFGYGLTFLSLEGLTDGKLERVVVGHNIAQSGKRADAVMRTRGAMDAICFVEIKKHTTDLLRPTPYRVGCWGPSEEVTGAIAQIQGTVALALRELDERLELKTRTGDPTGEVVFTHQPRSFLVVGTLSQFATPTGVNNERYRSFELFRRSITHPEILTFDELFQRARMIVKHAEE